MHSQASKTREADCTTTGSARCRGIARLIIKLPCEEPKICKMFSAILLKLCMECEAGTWAIERVPEVNAAAPREAEIRPPNSSSGRAFL